MTESLKRLIIRKAIRFGCNRDGALMRYCGVLYYVEIVKDEVTQCLERK